MNSFFQVPGEKSQVEDSSEVKKGDRDYIVLPIGAKDTGLSGKYWSDLETLGPRRPRNASNSPSSAAPPSTRSKTSSKSKESHEPVPIGKLNFYSCGYK